MRFFYKNCTNDSKSHTSHGLHTLEVCTLAMVMLNTVYATRTWRSCYTWSIYMVYLHGLCTWEVPWGIAMLMRYVWKLQCYITFDNKCPFYTHAPKLTYNTTSLNKILTQRVGLVQSRSHLIEN
jgi:hypothetical protein